MKTSLRSFRLQRLAVWALIVLFAFAFLSVGVPESHAAQPAGPARSLQPADTDDSDSSNNPEGSDNSDGANNSEGSDNSDSSDNGNGGTDDGNGGTPVRDNNPQQFADPEFFKNWDYSDPEATGKAAGPMPVADIARVFSDSRKKELTDRIEALEKTYHQDIGIVFTTVSSVFDSEARDFTEKYYLAAGYGYDKQRSGILMLVSVDDRQLTIWVDGKSKETFTDYGLREVFADVKKPLSDNHWFEAAETFVDDCEDFMEQAATGKPYDEDNKRHSKAVWLFWGIGSGVLSGLVAGGIVRAIYKRHRTARMQVGANDYLMPGTLQITGGYDQFIGSHVTRTARPKSDSSSSGGSIGSGSSGGRGISGGF